MKFSKIYYEMYTQISIKRAILKIIFYIRS